MKKLFIAMLAAITVGCATLTEDAMTPIALAFSDGSVGKCQLTNKRAAYSTAIPTTISIRKSDDALKYDCQTEDGREAVGTIASTMGGKIIASAIFLDLGIVDSITDKHRQYPASFVIPIMPNESGAEVSAEGTVEERLKRLESLKDRGLISSDEFEKARIEILEDL